MWINPVRNFGYRDAYWFLKNPIKKFEHIYNVKMS